MALLLILASFLILNVLNRISPERHAYSIDLASTILAALYGGLGPGLLVALSEAIIVSYYFVDPVGAIFESGPGLIRVVLDTSFAFLAAALVRKIRNFATDEMNARRDAEEAVRARERVLAVVSHDLRNPLSTVGMNAALIERTSADESMRRRARAIHRSSGQMDRLIADLLDAARIERGTFALEIEPHDVRALLDQTVETMHSQAAEKDVRLELHALEAYPPVPFDHGRMLQVLTNLVGNAIKFSPPRSIVVLSAILETGTITFRVTDQGPGIRSEDRERIFERNWQSAETAHLGTGLGLFISKSIVESHGGSIGVEEKAGPGATICFSIPVRGAARAQRAEVA